MLLILGAHRAYVLPAKVAACRLSLLISTLVMWQKLPAVCSTYQFAAHVCQAMPCYAMTCCAVLVRCGGVLCCAVLWLGWAVLCWAGLCCAMCNNGWCDMVCTKLTCNGHHYIGAELPSWGFAVTLVTFQGVCHGLHNRDLQPRKAKGVTTRCMLASRNK